MKCILYLQVNQFLELDKQHSEAPQRLFRIVTVAAAATIQFSPLKVLIFLHGANKLVWY